MIIDFHAHCFPDGLAHRAITTLEKEIGLKSSFDGTSGGLSMAVRSAGIDKAVVMPIATKPQQTVKINRWAAEIDDPNLLRFGTIHPEFAGYREEVKWLAANGFRGIKLHPESQVFNVDDPRYFPMYDAVFSAGLAILFHAGVDIAFKEPWHCLPDQLARVLDAFPGGVIIAAHMGGFRFWDEVDQHLLGRDIYLETSFSFRKLGSERMVNMMRSHGIEKILFGSDTPWTNQTVELEKIKSLDLTAAEMTAILGGNAQRLLR